MFRKGNNIEENISTPKTIYEYISKFPEDVQKILKTIKLVIKESAPEAVEKISYQMPTFYLRGNLVHFTAYKNHIGFYPTPGGIEVLKMNYQCTSGLKVLYNFQLINQRPMN